MATKDPSVSFPKRLQAHQKPSKGQITTFGSLKANDVFALPGELAENQQRLYMKAEEIRLGEATRVNAICLADGKLKDISTADAVWHFKKAKITV